MSAEGQVVERSGTSRSSNCVVSSATATLADLLNVFFSQAEDGIRGKLVTGVQTCALPISSVTRREQRVHLQGDGGARCGAYGWSADRFSSRRVREARRATRRRRPQILRLLRSTGWRSEERRVGKLRYRWSPSESE